MSETRSAELLRRFAEAHQQLLKLAQALQHHLLAADPQPGLEGLSLLADGLSRHAAFEEHCFADFAWPACRWSAETYQAEHQLIAHRLQQMRGVSEARVSASSASLRRQAWLSALQEAHRLQQVLEHHFDREESDWLPALMRIANGDVERIVERLRTQQADAVTHRWRDAVARYCALLND